MHRPTLEHLLAPMDIAEFAREFWERRHLYVARDNPDYYADILTLQDLDEYLSRNDIRYPSLRMIRAGKPIPVADFSRPLKFGAYSSEGLIDVDRVYQFYQEGASIVLQLMRSSIRSVSSFANRLQRDLGFNVECTMYVTPPSEQGFTTHYDTHSVLVIQIAGHKRWRLYDFPKRYPLLSDTFDTVKYSAPEPAHEITLNPGDMLYVPRGLAHDAVSTRDSKSVHITVGLFPPMWADIFETGLRQLKDDVRFRRAPVAFFLPEKAAQFAEQYSEKWEDALRRSELDGLLSATLRKHLNRQSRVTDGWFLRSAENPLLQPSTKVRTREDIVWQVEAGEKSVAVYFYDKRLVLPLAVEPAVHRLLSGELLPINQLQSNLDSESGIILVRRFLEAGLVEISD